MLASADSVCQLGEIGMALVGSGSLNAGRHRVSRSVKEAVITAARGQCQSCGVTGVPLELRHVVPVIDGGSSEAENLEAVCPNCHQVYASAPRESEFLAFFIWAPRG